MEISRKLLKFKHHILFAIAFFLMIFSLIYLTPRFLDILAYFWPLFLSTALFLVTVLLFAKSSPLSTEVPAEKATERLLDFVVGQPELVQSADEECLKAKHNNM
ncbi:unnamed protein product [Camellia sinensis]